MSTQPIVMPNEGSERVEYAVEWTFPIGHRTYTLGSFSRAECEERIARQDRPGVVGELVQCTISRSPWEPVLPAGVLRLREIAAEEYGGIRVAELGDGVVEGYNVVAFTDDPEQAIRAVRAHFAMVHNEFPSLLLVREEEPVRWWQVFDTCGCGDSCPHGDPEDEDTAHDCKRSGLPPCNTEGETSWIGVLAEQDAPGAVPFVEITALDSYTRDEWMVLTQRLLGDAERRLRKLAETCVAVKTSLDKPYSDAPETTPWKQLVERPTRDAYGLAQDIRRELKARGVTS